MDELELCHVGYRRYFKESTSFNALDNKLLLEDKFPETEKWDKVVEKVYTAHDLSHRRR